MSATKDPSTRDFIAQTNVTIKMRISESGFNVFQFGTVTAFIVLAIIHFFCDQRFGEGIITKLAGIFDPVNEASITTVFSMLNLLISAILLFVIYLNRRKLQDVGAVYWLILSLVFVGLSIDEVAQLHERGGNLITDKGSSIVDFGEHFNPDFIVTGLFAAVVFVVFVPFLRQLDRRTLVLFLVAGGMFVSGAVLLELVELYLLKQNIAAEGDSLLQVRSIVEEALEMYAIALFNVTLFGLVPQRKIILK